MISLEKNLPVVLPTHCYTRARFRLNNLGIIKIRWIPVEQREKPSKAKGALYYIYYKYSFYILNSFCVYVRLFFFFFYFFLFDGIRANTIFPPVFVLRNGLNTRTCALRLKEINGNLLSPSAKTEEKYLQKFG